MQKMSTAEYTQPTTVARAARGAQGFTLARVAPVPWRQALLRHQPLRAAAPAAGGHAAAALRGSARLPGLAGQKQKGECCRENGSWREDPMYYPANHIISKPSANLVYI